MEGRKVRSATVSESPPTGCSRKREIATAYGDVAPETTKTSEKRSRCRERES